jgi:hypothetical protein
VTTRRARKAQSRVDAGFVIEQLAGPQPAADDIRRFPAELKNVAGTPCFVVYRLRLTGPGRVTG